MWLLSHAGVTVLPLVWGGGGGGEGGDITVRGSHLCAAPLANKHIP